MFVIQQAHVTTAKPQLPNTYTPLVDSLSLFRGISIGGSAITGIGLDLCDNGLEVL